MFPRGKEKRGFFFFSGNFEELMVSLDREERRGKRKTEEKLKISGHEAPPSRSVLLRSSFKKSEKSELLLPLPSISLSSDLFLPPRASSTRRMPTPLLRNGVIQSRTIGDRGLGEVTSAREVTRKEEREKLRVECGGKWRACDVQRVSVFPPLSYLRNSSLRPLWRSRSRLCGTLAILIDR